jgi:hypothetical protein
VKLDNSDEEKRILDWHELESAYESENNRKNVKKCMMNI